MKFTSIAFSTLAALTFGLAVPASASGDDHGHRDRNHVEPGEHRDGRQQDRAKPHSENRERAGRDHDKDHADNRPRDHRGDNDGRRQGRRS